VTSTGGKQDESQRTNWTEIAQTLAAYVAVPVALLYPFGFLALFVQFTNYFYLDFYTAWYAASLVNRMVAIGQGTTILALALVGSVLLSAVVALILLKNRKRSETSRLKKTTVLATKLTTLLTIILILYIAFSRILAGGRVSMFVLRGRLTADCNPEQARRHQLNLLPDSLFPAALFLAGCFIGGWVIYRSYQRYRENADATLWPGSRRSASQDDLSLLTFGSLPLPTPRFFGRGVTEGWIRSGLALAYVFSAVASIVLAVFTPAFVPFMTYGGTIEYNGGKEPTDNRFLSHTEGQWYFLHRVGRESEDKTNQWSPPDYRIISLEDGQAEHVRVSPNPPRASRVAPLPFGLGWEELKLSKNHCEPKTRK
jgi:hypothetical protein